MKDIHYAYAVARIRYHETRLLTGAELELLVTSETYEDAVSRLADKGWFVPDDLEQINAILETELKKSWDLLTEAAPDIRDLSMLVVKNDFHNLKAALKCMVNDDDHPADYILTPSITDPEQVIHAVETHDFTALPAYLGDAGEKAYDAIVRLNNGQLADAAIDTACMETMLAFARETKNELLIKIAGIICGTANLKAAFRCIRTGKDKDFMEKTLVTVPGLLDKHELIEAASKGKEALCAYLRNTPLAEASDAFEAGSTAFEKWCDDAVMQEVLPAKRSAFGAEPLVAYFIAKEAEIKNVRMILGAKRSRLGTEVIRERVRKLYV